MEESQKKQAWISALRLLAATPKTRSALTKILSEKGYDGEVIRETLDQLEKQGVLSDRSYAMNLVSKFTLAKPSGRRKIEFELKRRGIAAKLREEIVCKMNSEEENERAREIAIGRWERFKNMTAEKRKKRVYDFLVRRGFDFQLSRDLVEGLAQGAQDA